MNGRVLIIGWDGATWDVLEPFIADGDLPNLARLRDNGTWGHLRSTIPPLSAPAWSTFLTGKNPARHGVFHFADWGDATGDTLNSSSLVDASSIDSPTMWDVAGHHGRKVGVINVPMSYPPRPVNGFMITGLLTPPDAAVFTHPPALSADLTDYQIDLDRFIAQKPFATTDGEKKPKRVVKADLELVEEFRVMEELRADTALGLMRSEPWDLFAVVFTAPDRMGHYLWPYHRAADLDGSPEAAALHEAVRSFYRELDESIGRLVAEAGDDASVMVLSDHGMGPIYTKNTHWNKWLFDRGHVKLAASSGRTIDGWLLKLGLPRDKLRRIAARIPGLLSSKPAKSVKLAPTAEIDKAASSAYYERWFDPVGGIRINATGAERERIRDELVPLIADVVDPGSGEPIVREVLKREDCLVGPHAERAPDIIMIMNPDYGSSTRMSNYSSIVTDRPQITDPGGHQLDGILVCAGASVGAESEPRPDLEIQDIAPTVMHLMGLGVPSDMDGRVLTECFAPGSEADRDVTYIDPMAWWPDEETARPPAEDRSKADEEAVRDRLRALGYFE